MRHVVLDNEAVQALRDPFSTKHRRVVAHLASVVQRRRKGASVLPVVPTAVRVEAGWDRSATDAAAINRFRVVDRSLDAPAADVAAAIRTRTGASVADAHIGAAVRGLPDGEVVVLGSDPRDMELVTQPRAVIAVRV